MRTFKLVTVWIVCVLLGAGLGFAAGWALWKLGFELIGSAVALAGAAAGGLLILAWLLSTDFARRWE